MAMDIRNDRDVRVAYNIISTMAPYIDQCDDPVKAAHALDEIKRNIRAYYKAQDEERQVTLVRDYGIDGHVIRFDMPDVSDPEAWFDDNERMECRPSMYDCTGQAFTQWHKICMLGGRMVCYHSIGFDV